MSFEEFLESQRRKNLVMEDLEAVRQACADCSLVGASVNANSRVKYGREFVNAQIQGYSEEMPAIMAQAFQFGLEAQSGHYVAMLRGMEAFDPEPIRQAGGLARRRGAFMASVVLPSEIRRTVEAAVAVALAPKILDPTSA